MVQAVQMYQTSDGTFFEDSQEAAIHESSLKNKAIIEAFVDKHFPIPAPVAVTNEDGSPKLDDEGKQVFEKKQNNNRGPARKAISLWLLENPVAA